MKKRSSEHQGSMPVTVLQTADCQAVREKRVLGPSLYTVQIPDRDTVWGLGTHSGWDRAPGRNGGLDTG